ncbi:hypothetical protein NX059_011745 [Plenodomus lindquistii]|nr:hypothetical protein NX059_011745 [Plenodomus lindquistii]
MSDFKLYIAQNARQILGVAKIASEDEIRAAYKVMALRHHPDKVGEAEQETATARFQKIQAAYEYCLANPYVEPIPGSPTTNQKFDHHAEKFSHPRREQPQRASGNNSEEACETRRREHKGNFEADPAEARKAQASEEVKHQPKSNISKFRARRKYVIAPAVASGPKWDNIGGDIKTATGTWRDEHDAHHNSKLTPQQRLSLFQKQNEALSNRVPTFGLDEKSQELQDSKEEKRRAMLEELTRAVKHAEALKSQPKSKSEDEEEEYMELPVRAYPLSSFFT